jgi:hypothetical protein
VSPSTILGTPLKSAAFVDEQKSKIKTPIEGIRAWRKIMH